MTSAGRSGRTTPAPISASPPTTHETDFADARPADRRGALATAVHAQEALPTADGDPAADPRFQEKVSYCLGLQIGRNLKEDRIPIELAGLVSGLRDALADQAPQLSEAERNAVMSRFQQIMQQKTEQRMADTATDNLTKGQEFLAANRSKEGVQETPSGLQYKPLESGDGATPGPTDTVRCHYHGTLIDGTVFDSSYERGQPAEFPVNRVIAGWTEALQMMKVGDKWEVYLPSQIAYGAQGAGGAIGPNATLVFTIELLDIVD